VDPVNLAISEAGKGTELYGLMWFVRGLIWVVEELHEHPVIGIPVGIVLICVLIVVVVRIVQLLRGKI
jgi:Flp pilus assembly protein TadB